MNLPNKLTMLRVIMVPFFMAFAILTVLIIFSFRFPLSFPVIAAVRCRD